MLGAILLIGVILNAAGDAGSQVVQWEFGPKEATPLSGKGNVQHDQAGPRPPEFPEMAANNTAVRVDANAYLSVPDTGTTATSTLRTATPSQSKHG